MIFALTLIPAFSIATLPTPQLAPALLQFFDEIR